MSQQELGKIKFSLRDFFFVIFFKLHVFVGIFLLIVVSTALYAFHVTPIYRASTYILLKPIIDSRKFPVTGQNFFDVEPLTEIDINTELEIITSREVVLDIIKKLDVKMPTDEAVKYVSNNVEASSVTASFAIRISKEGYDPEDIVKIVNAYTESYVSRHIEVHRSKNEIHFYEKKVKEKEEELHEVQKKLISLIKKYNIIDIEIQKEKNIEKILSLKEKNIEIDCELSEKINMINSIKKNHFNVDIEAFRGSEAIKNMFLAIYPSLLQEREKVFSLYTKDSIEYIDVVRKIDRFNEEIKREKEKILNGIYLRMESLKLQKIIIEKEVDSIEKRLSEISEIDIEYKNIISAIDQIRSTYSLYLNKLEDERIQEKMDISGASNISIISQAHVPLAPIFPRKSFMLSAAVAVGFCASVAFTFVAYYLDYTVKREEDLVLLTEAPVIASLEDIAALPLTTHIYSLL